MKKMLISLGGLSLLLMNACTCRPEVEGFSLYDSSIEHSDTAPARFTVFNILGRFSTPEGQGVDYASSSELRPQYSEVYVFDVTKDCKYYDYEKSDCPIVWRAQTHPDRSPWHITYGENGDSLETIQGPQKLAPHNSYRIVVALREPDSRCVSEVGSHNFSFREGGRIHPVDKEEIRGYVPLPDPTGPTALKQPPAMKDRLNRLAKQYERLNGHPLLPLSYGEEVAAEKPNR